MRREAVSMVIESCLIRHMLALLTGERKRKTGALKHFLFNFFKYHMLLKGSPTLHSHRHGFEAETVSIVLSTEERS